MRSFEFARKKDENGKFIDGVKAYEGAQLPEYQTKGSAGADFFAAEEVTIPSIWKAAFDSISDKIIDIFKTRKWDDTIKPIEPVLVHTGIKSCMEDDEVLELYNRSSNPKKFGMILANSVGVIDRDYYNNESNDGEIMFAFYNFSFVDKTVKVGDRIGQGVFKKFLRPEIGLRVKEEDRTGGIGSTN